MRGKNVYVKSPNNVPTTEDGCKILYSNILDNAQCIVLKSILADIIDEEKDSLRFYYLGNNYKTKVEHIGVERGTAIDQVLIF
jgi:CRISPR-associated protein Cas2